jgi:hypothetical protein
MRLLCHALSLPRKDGSVSDPAVKPDLMSVADVLLSE